MCDRVIESVSALACAGDKVAFTTDSEIVRKSFSYIPEDHASGFDSLFADDTGKEAIDTSYVSHIYYCAAKTCERNNELSVCSKAKVEKELKSSFVFVSEESVKNQMQNKLGAEFDPNTLCKLADCKGSETQMNACYESIKQELGDNGEEILLAYSRVPNSSIASQTNSPGSSYTPYVRSSFAQSFLGDYAKKEEPVATTEVPSTGSSERSSEGTSGREVAAVAAQRSSQTSTSSNSSEPSRNVVTANDAFREFMSQRLNSISSSPTIASARNSGGNSTGTATGITPNDRRALESLNQASETIEELRDSYRKSAFERMERLVEKSKEVNRANGSFTGFTSGTQANDSSAASSSGFSTRSNTSNDRANSMNSAAQISNNDQDVSASIANSTDVETTGGNAATSGRGPASIGAAPRLSFNSAGQPTLNVSLNELPSMNPAKVENEGVDIAKPFKLAVKVDDQVYTVEVRSSIVKGKRILEPLLDGLSVSLKAEILRSPLFKEYRSLMAIN